MWTFQLLVRFKITVTAHRSGCARAAVPYRPARPCRAAKNPLWKTSKSHKSQTAEGKENFRIPLRRVLCIQWAPPETVCVGFIDRCAEWAIWGFAISVCNTLHQMRRWFYKNPNQTWCEWKVGCINLFHINLLNIRWYWVAQSDNLTTRSETRTGRIEYRSCTEPGWFQLGSAWVLESTCAE